MNIILNNYADALSFEEALDEVSQGAFHLGIAISYVQRSGWDILRKRTSSVLPANIRLVFTDQMGITQPEAIRRAIRDGANVRNFSDRGIYHPKVILSYDDKNQPIRCLVGSANLSYSALKTSCEAGYLLRSSDELLLVHEWFENLYSRHSSNVTDLDLREMEARWLEAATRRTQATLSTAPPHVAPNPVEARPEDIDTLEDIFTTMQTPVGVLGFDYARNNIRNLARAGEVLNAWNEISILHTPLASKQRSEMRLLGFCDGSQLSDLGRAVLQDLTPQGIALRWCAWLQLTRDNDLSSINPGLVAAKEVLKQFWLLNRDVRNFFIENARSPRPEKARLQTIECLCNVQSAIVQTLTLDNIRTLSTLLENRERLRLPEHIEKAIREYYNNKGARSWDSEDRYIIPNAWRDAANTES